MNPPRSSETKRLPEGVSMMSTGLCVCCVFVVCCVLVVCVCLCVCVRVCVCVSNTELEQKRTVSTPVCMYVCLCPT